MHIVGAVPGQGYVVPSPPLTAFVFVFVFVFVFDNLNLNLSLYGVDYCLARRRPTAGQQLGIRARYCLGRVPWGEALVYLRPFAFFLEYFDFYYNFSKKKNTQ